MVEDVKRGQKFARTNVIGALHNGIHVAVTCYHQRTNSVFFESWFKDVLLKEIPSGYTVILDNARFHRKEVLQKLARTKVRLLFLPPYSPDYNPIEQSWANMKRFIRNYLTDYVSIYSFFRNKKY